MKKLTKSAVSDPYVTSVDMIGDSYTFLIAREAFFGIQRFEEFAAALNIPRARLAERLKHLIASGVFEKRIYQTTPKRYEYRFTEKGLSFYPIALTLLEWGDTWRPHADRIVLRHRPCGALLVHKTLCCTCGDEVAYENVIWPTASSLQGATTHRSNVKGWRKTGRLTDVSDRADSAAETLNAIGDRWSLLIIYLALHGPFRFKDAIIKLGVADNILSNRLVHLTEQGLLERETSSRQSAYFATEGGLALLPTILALRQWAFDWALSERGKWSELHHASCGAALRTKCRCAACGGEIKPNEVEVLSGSFVGNRE